MYSQKASMRKSWSIDNLESALRSYGLDNTKEDTLISSTKISFFKFSISSTKKSKKLPITKQPSELNLASLLSEESALRAQDWYEISEVIKVQSLEELRQKQQAFELSSKVRAMSLESAKQAQERMAKFKLEEAEITHRHEMASIAFRYDMQDIALQHQNNVLGALFNARGGGMLSSVSERTIKLPPLFEERDVDDCSVDTSLSMIGQACPHGASGAE